MYPLFSCLSNTKLATEALFVCECSAILVAKKLNAAFSTPVRCDRALSKLIPIFIIFSAPLPKVSLTTRAPAHAEQAGCMGFLQKQVTQVQRNTRTSEGMDSRPRTQVIRPTHKTPIAHSKKRKQGYVTVCEIEVQARSHQRAKANMQVTLPPLD